LCLGQETPSKVVASKNDKQIAGSENLLQLYMPFVNVYSLYREHWPIFGGLPEDI
jgi:hypothetical protein